MARRSIRAFAPGSIPPRRRRESRPGSRSRCASTWRKRWQRPHEIAPEGLAYARFDREGNIARVPADPARWGDAVIMRKEIPTSYHLAVVHDDAGQGVTHVVRGRDLEAATDLHVLLQCLIGLPTPLYHHHDLIRDESGDKLAKSRVSTPIAQLREEGRGSGGLAGDAGIRGLIGAMRAVHAEQHRNAPARPCLT